MVDLQVVDLEALPVNTDLGDGFNYGRFAVRLLTPTLTRWQVDGSITDPENGSWGGFLANLDWAGRYHEAPRDDPNRFVGTIFGVGKLWPAYALNAARKGLLLAEFSQQFTSTQSLLRQYPKLVGASCESAVKAGDLRWMQFCRGGAVLVGEGSHQRMWGISAFLPDEDHVVANLLGTLAQTTRERQAAPSTPA